MRLTQVVKNSIINKAVSFNGAAYYFLKNLQGDVIAITNSDGEVIARYTYDAWGKVLSVTDNAGNAITDTSNVALVNPYRYRSYYYDTETSLYYLNSRYYNPKVGRFINADEVVIAILGEEAIGVNLFAYCKNTVTSLKDPYGYWYEEVGYISTLQKLLQFITKITDYVDRKNGSKKAGVIAKVFRFIIEGIKKFRIGEIVSAIGFVLGFSPSADKELSNIAKLTLKLASKASNKSGSYYSVYLLCGSHKNQYKIEERYLSRLQQREVIEFRKNNNHNVLKNLLTSIGVKMTKRTVAWRYSY